MSDNTGVGSDTSPPPFPENAEYIPDAEADDEFCLDDRPYQVMPPLDPDEYESLRESIRKNGVTDAIHITGDNDILDGHHRVLALRELGLWGDEKKEPPYAIHARFGDNVDEEQHYRELAWELNMNQRHLDSEQKKDLIKRRLKQLDKNEDYRPNHEVADTLGVSTSWVREVRRRLEGSGNIRTAANITTDTSGRRTEEDAQSQRQSVKEIIREDPTRSNRSIARELDVSHPFVGGVREELGKPSVPSWWEEQVHQESLWSYGVPDGVQILAFKDVEDNWHIQLKSRQFYESRDLVGRGLNEGYCIAVAATDSKVKAAEITQEFANNVEKCISQKAEELRECGYTVEYEPTTTGTDSGEAT